MRLALALLLAVALVYGCGCAGVLVRGEDVWSFALGQGLVEVVETPGYLACTAPEVATPARVLLYSSKTGYGPRARCQTVDPGRRITVEGGPISQALAGFLGLVAGLLVP